ncbi:MAG TPA: acyltransferase family protein [Ktedonobacteraceae bacterium]|nr:acyltransferase family protein [Ktedonobacteraceae bacterium]
MIAGYFTPGSYDRKGAGPFLRDRLVRLGIPLLIYDSLIQPVVVYIAAGFPGAYGKFYTTYLLTLSGIGQGPVWFIEALLFFVMLYALWRRLNLKWSQVHPLVTASTESINPARVHPYPTTRAILLYIVGLALITFVIRIWFPFGSWFPPLNQNLGEFPQYISMFILGLIAYRCGWLTHIPNAVGKRWFWVALIDLVLFIPLVILGGGPLSIGYFLGGLHWQALVYALWEASLVVAISISLPVLFRQRWNRQGRLAKDLASSVYTVYLIHPLILVGFSYTFHVVALYPLLKFGIAVLITFPLCFMVSLVIRKIPLVNRVL